MRFIKSDHLETQDIEIPRRSLYLIQDDARKKWSHGIAPRKKDNIGGMIQHRQRRVSITYCKVKKAQVKTINPEGAVAGLLKEKFQIIPTEMIIK